MDGSKENGRRKKMKINRTRERILDKSIELFNRKQASNVSTVQISTALEISPGNLYYYYTNKEEVIRCTWKERMVPEITEILETAEEINDKKDLEQYLKDYYADDNHEHMARPGMVYISHPSEYGTLYSKAELEALSSVCKTYELPLFMDGARLGYGLMSKDTDVTLPDIAKTDALIIRRSFSNLLVDRCHFLRFQKGAGILHLNGKTLRLPDPKVNMPDLRGAASVNETILHHWLNDKPRKILILDSVITL